MKKIIFTLIFSFSIIFIQAQCFDLYVKTPRQNNVKACYSGGYSSSQVASADTFSRTFAISVLGGATNNYNCHGYAWHVKEGGSQYWINNMLSEASNLNAYWNDYSYVLYDKNNNPHKDNLKIFYGSTTIAKDHSAITTSSDCFYF